MKRKIICFCMIIISSKMFSQINENELLSFMVYGNNFIATIALPETWNVDMSYASRVRANGYFYLKNTAVIIHL